MACRHNVEFLDKKPQYLILGIKPDGKKNLPPTFENVVLLSDNMNDLLIKCSELTHFKTFHIDKPFKSEYTIKLMITQREYKMKKEIELGEYDRIKKKYSLK